MSFQARWLRIKPELAGELSLKTQPDEQKTKTQTHLANQARTPSNP